jgi:hypothetical protein
MSDQKIIEFVSRRAKSAPPEEQDVAVMALKLIEDQAEIVNDYRRIVEEQDAVIAQQRRSITDLLDEVNATFGVFSEVRRGGRVRSWLIGLALGVLIGLLL